METLKDIFDIDVTDGFGRKIASEEALEFYNDLRKSAIDDIKELRKESLDAGHGDPLDDDSECLKHDGGCAEAGFCVDPNPEIIEYIMKKNNLTEADLND